MWPHRSFLDSFGKIDILANAAAGLEAQPVHPDDIYLSFLPLGHMFERTIGQYLMLMAGAPIAYASSVRKVTEAFSIPAEMKSLTTTWSYFE